MDYAQLQVPNFLNCNINTQQNIYLHVRIWLNHMKQPFLQVKKQVNISSFI